MGLEKVRGERYEEIVDFFPFMVLVLVLVLAEDDWRCALLLTSPGSWMF
jgi:hypothetical protein